MNTRIKPHQQVIAVVTLVFVTLFLVTGEFVSSGAESVDKLSETIRSEFDWKVSPSEEGSVVHVEESALTHRPTSFADKQQSNRLEEVLDPAYGTNGVSASVLSRGCTLSNDFTVSHSVVIDYCELMIVREVQDTCRVIPHLVEVIIDWDAQDCEDRQIEFLNPVLDWVESDVIRPRSD